MIARSMLIRLMPLAAAILLALSHPSSAADPAPFIHETFDSLERWEPFTFPKIKRHSAYTVFTSGEGERSLLAESDASASALILKDEFDVYAYPRVSWRWKVENLYEKADARKKSGDDYPARVYVMFKYDPDRAPLAERIKYGIAKALYGQYPPKSSLNYIWSSKQHPERIIPNPYVSAARMVLLRKGPDRLGQWVEESVNIIDDYREAFGEDPPATARIAVMNDSDDTRESSRSFFDDLAVSP